MFPLYAQVAPGEPALPGSESAASAGQMPGAQSPVPAGENPSTAPEPLVPDESSILLGETSDVPPSAEGGASSVFVLFRMVLVLALSALAIYGVIFFIKRLARPTENRDPHLKILARAPLGADTFAAVVSVGSRAWLVGAGSSSVSLISEITDPESVETMLLDDARRTAEAGTGRGFDFRSLIRRFGAPGGGASGQNGSVSLRATSASGGEDTPFDETNSPEGDSVAGALRRQRERLKRL